MRNLIISKKCKLSNCKTFSKISVIYGLDNNCKTVSGKSRNGVVGFSQIKGSQEVESGCLGV